MSASLLDHAFAHHIWATESLLDECEALTAEQLKIPVPGAFGSISDTLRHLVTTDSWYLTLFREWPLRDEDWVEANLGELRSMITANGVAWMELLAGDLDGETDVVEHGDGWRFYSPLGLRLAQVVHHGTDHRSQMCTALTSLGLTPPDLDLWRFGEMTGRTRGEKA